MEQALSRSVDRLKADLSQQGFVERTMTYGGATYSVWMKGCGNPNDASFVSDFMHTNAGDSNALRVYKIDTDTGRIGVTREGFAQEQNSTRIGRIADKYSQDVQAGQRAIDAVEEPTRSVTQSIVKAGQDAVNTVASAFGLSRPIPTEEDQAQRAQAAVVRSGRSRPGTVVAETAMGEGAGVQSAAVDVEIPQAEAPGAEEKRVSGRGDTTTIPQADLRGNAYEFRISYDPSKLEPGYTDADLQSVKFFERPENRDAVVNFSYRNLSVGREWNNDLGGKLFHRVYSRLFERVDFSLVDANGGVQQNFAVYIDREKAEQLGVNTADPLALINAGVILRIMQGAVGNETRWRRGGTEDVIAAWAEFIKSHEEEGSKMRARSA